MMSLALYIHWPFCVSKCPYCDFNSLPLVAPVEEEKWAQAYGTELAHYAQRLGPRAVSSIYFGGGTPSLMQPQTVDAVLRSITKHWPLADSCEITIEANPSSSEIEKFKSFRLAGVNRLSLGVQALDDASLQFLGRAHDAQAARRAIEAAAQAFDRWSFDLIYARAGQSCEDWSKELDQALAFAPRHLSLYQLTIEEGTPFYKRARSEKLQAENEAAAEMYEFTQEKLSHAGLPAYEISNHAAIGQESRHNLAYWQYDSSIGIGPGAHGRFVDADGDRIATENYRRPKDWMGHVESAGQGCEKEETIDIATAQREALMMGLRLTAGIDKMAWEKKFGQTLEQFLPADKMAGLVQEGLLGTNGDFFCATAQGRQRLDAVLRHLLV